MLKAGSDPDIRTLKKLTCLTGKLYWFSFSNIYLIGFKIIVIIPKMLLKNIPILIIHVLSINNHKISIHYIKQTRNASVTSFMIKFPAISNTI